jgi:hypothetical protein
VTGGIAVCPECGGVTGAHAISCPTIVQATAVPAGRPMPATTCTSCGATGYHRSGCPAALQSRPEHRRERPSFKAVIQKVIQVDVDTGRTAGPANLTDQIVAELLREGWHFE